jgi:PAS domain S-box-containing protein
MVLSSVIHDEGGERYTAVVFRDLTELQRSEAALRESEALYRTLFTLAPSGVVYTGLDGHVLAFNDRVAEQLGYSREEFGRLAIWDIDVSEDQARFEARSRHILEAGHAEFEARHRTRSGELLDVSVRVVRTDFGGRPAILSTVDDITQARRLERELRDRLAERDEREHWLQASQRVARLGHYVFELSQDRWTSSPALDALFGLGPQDARTGATWLALVHPDEREEMGEYLRVVVTTGTRFDREYRIGRRGEPDRWVHGLGDVERDAAGRPWRMVGTIQDVTARRQAEQAREALSEQLRQAQKMEGLGRLAGGVAHDFNNLLVVVLTCAGNIQARLAKGLEPEREDVEEILTAGQRGRDLTSQLLALARKQVVAPAPLELNEALRGAERLLRRLLREDVELHLELQPGLWPLIADAGQLQQVLLNLAVNARDAMPTGGRLTLSTANLEPAHADDGGWQGAPRPPGPLICLVVEDTGAGIPVEDWPRVFEPFFTTKPHGQGTGLGLATVYGIVQQSGGSVRFRTGPGQGTAFELCWPRGDAQATGDTPPEPPAKAAAWPHERVLLVEDDDLVRGSTARALRRAGYDVTPASGGSAALAVLSQGGPPFDLLLTDVVMPGMNGRQLAAVVQGVSPGLRVLYMSGYTHDIMAPEGAIQPGLDLIEKPFTTPALLDRVRGALDTAAPRPP